MTRLELGQRIPPSVASKLIDYAWTGGPAVGVGAMTVAARDSTDDRDRIDERQDVGRSRLH